MQHHLRYKKNTRQILRTLKTFIVLFSSVTSYSQQHISFNDKKKGQIYIMWGWNRAAYTGSNIHLRGGDYDFTLYKVKAHDRPTPFSYNDYMKFNRLTIPQTNFRLGYFMKDNLAVSLGFDHMKYVMDQDQVVRITGRIDHDGSFKGTYDGDKKLTSDFLTLEHTNGLNYINAEGEKYMTWYSGAGKKCIISGFVGIGAGILFPRSDIGLLNYERSNEFHVSGFGLSAKAGMQVTLFKHFIIKIENKYGYINMPDIKLHKKGIFGKGKQAFWFTELDGMVGATFAFKQKKIRNKTTVNYKE